MLPVFLSPRPMTAVLTIPTVLLIHIAPRALAAVTASVNVLKDPRPAYYYGILFAAVMVKPIPIVAMPPRREPMWLQVVNVKAPG